MDKSKLDIKKFYDNLADNWDKTRPKYTLSVFEKITSRFDKSKPYSILDFGCGTGLLCKYLYDNFPKAKVDGVDISSQMIKKAKKNCPEGTFYTGNILSLKLPQYDIIVSKDVFNYVRDIPRVISRLNNLLDKNGILIIANRDREQATKETILSSLQLLNYQISKEQFSFTPTEEEINSFLGTLLDFNDSHKQIIKDMLLASGSYYIVNARKS